MNMNKKIAFEYVMINIGIYLFISFIEAYPLKPLIDNIGTSFLITMVSYNVLLLIVNPLITKIIADIIINKIIEKNNALNNNQ